MDLCQSSHPSSEPMYPTQGFSLGKSLYLGSKACRVRTWLSHCGEASPTWCMVAHRWQHCTQLSGEGHHWATQVYFLLLDLLLALWLLHYFLYSGPASSTGSNRCFYGDHDALAVKVRKSEEGDKGLSPLRLRKTQNVGLPLPGKSPNH